MLVCFVSFPHDAMGLSVVCDCRICWSYSLAFLSYTHLSVLLFGKSTLKKIVCGVEAVSVLCLFLAVTLVCGL